MMCCEQYGGKWYPPKNDSKSLSVCPFRGASKLEVRKAKGYSKMDDFLGYMVKVYGAEIYQNPERLKNLIGDLYGGEEREKKLFRRALVDEKLSVKVYEIAQKPENERKPFYNRLASQFAEGNYFPLELGLKVVGNLVNGLTGTIVENGKSILDGFSAVGKEASVLDRVRDESELGDQLSQLLLGILYDEGVGGIEQDYGKAEAWYRKSAEQGNAAAQYKMGECYQRGRGVGKDYMIAVKWYRKAAEQGYAAAQHKMGECYQRGRGVGKDYMIAVKWYRKAAEQGYAAAQHKMGECYQRGREVGKDYMIAVEWYRKAAEQEYAAAQFRLSLLYQNGVGVEKDKIKAEELCWKAAEQGHAPALVWLARYYEEENEVESIELYRKAANSYWIEAGRGDSFALVELRHIYYALGDKMKAEEWYQWFSERCNPAVQKQEGDRFYSRKDYTKAVEWYRKAAERGDFDAQKCLGECYSYGYGVEKNEERAEEWYRKAAEQGNANEQYNLGTRYDNGYGVEKNCTKAAEWYRKAAEQGNAGAQYKLGECYYCGKGIKQDYVKAVEWYRRAAEQGDNNAKYALGGCYYYGDGVEQDYKKSKEWYRKSGRMSPVENMELIKKIVEASRIFP